jgi:hypothetical protein
MENSVIDKVLKKNCPLYRGIYACDRLPDAVLRPSVIVVNTDPASKPGRHWICIYFDEDGYGEFFDSFGLGPKRVFERYMNEHSIAWTFNKKQMQSLVSRFCGHYCIWYCMLKCKKVTLNKLMCSMSTDTGLNDFLVHRFACRLI